MADTGMREKKPSFQQRGLDEVPPVLPPTPTATVPKPFLPARAQQRAQTSWAESPSAARQAAVRLWDGSQCQAQGQFSRPLINVLWPKVQFQFLLWLPLIQKPTHAEVSKREETTNGDG
jgi:hypothetical protein